MNQRADKTPPAYQIHRGALLGVIVIGLLAFVLFLIIAGPVLVTVVDRMVQSLHDGWNWSLF